MTSRNERRYATTSMVNFHTVGDTPRDATEIHPNEEVRLNWNPRHKETLECENLEITELGYELCGGFDTQDHSQLRDPTQRVEGR